MSIARILSKVRQQSLTVNTSGEEKVSKGAALVQSKVEGMKHLVKFLESIQKNHNLKNNPRGFNAENTLTSIKNIVKDVPGVKF